MRRALGGLNEVRCVHILGSTVKGCVCVQLVPLSVMSKGTRPQAGLWLFIHTSEKSSIERLTRIRLRKKPSRVFREAFHKVPNERSMISSLQSIAQMP